MYALTENLLLLQVIQRITQNDNRFEKYCREPTKTIADNFTLFLSCFGQFFVIAFFILIILFVLSKFVELNCMWVVVQHFPKTFCSTFLSCFKFLRLNLLADVWFAANWNLQFNSLRTLLCKMHKCCTHFFYLLQI